MTTRGPLKASEITAREIVNFIADGEFKTGDRLPHEQAMMEQFVVGRGSLREALRLLEVQGLISVKAGVTGGPVVGEATPDALGRTLSLFFRMSNATYEDVAEAYLALMPLIVRLATHNPDREQLEERLGQCLHAAEEPGIALSDEIRELTHFHFVLNDLCGNPALSLISTALHSLFTDHVTRVSDPADILPHCRRDHHAISDAVISGNSEAAANMIDTHMRRIVAFHKRRAPELFTQSVRWR